MGNGVNLFKSLFADEYYPYTANTLMSAKPTSKVIKDSNDQTVATIVYSGNELRGLLKVGTDGLYADGDIDDGSGSTAVKFGEENTDNVTFDYDSNNNWLRGALPNCNTSIDWNPETVSELPYTLVNSNVLSSNDKSWTLYNGNLFIRDTSKTENELRSIIANKKIVYLLATPTTAVSTAWSNPIIAKEGGTEEFTDTRAVKMFTGHDTIYGTDMTVNKAEFGTTVYGGSVDFTTGEVISNKNADGTDKTAKTIAISPVMVGVFEGDNYIISDANGSNSVKYFKKG